MSVKVAVRCRPLSVLEKRDEHAVGVFMKDKEVEVLSTSAGKSDRFCFDEVLCSVHNSRNFDGQRQYASQEKVYTSVASDLMNDFVAGYNGCIFAYGQTGTGKTYSMVGTSTDPGIISRVAKTIFNETKNLSSKQIQTSVEVSFFEIYNENMRSLLCPGDDKTTRPVMCVREHPKFGLLIEGLTKLVVSTEKELLQLLEEGNKVRSVGSTTTNAFSSRSHAIFAITLTQKQTKDSLTTTKISKLNLVDLAGSERTLKGVQTGKQLVEGANINKSITCLRNVIKSLSEKQESGKVQHIPHRDSLLTWILRDNFGGNSKTVMLATISPSIQQYEETMSTLRYANRAKKIVNCAIVNESSNNELIYALQKEIEQLKAQVKGATDIERARLMEHLGTSEAFYKEFKMSLEEKLAESKSMMKIHQKHILDLEKQLEAQSGKSAEKMRNLAAVESDKKAHLNEISKKSMNVVLILEDDATKEKDFICAPLQSTNDGNSSVRNLINTFESMGKGSSTVKQSTVDNELLGTSIVSHHVNFYEKMGVGEDLTPAQRLRTCVRKTTLVEDNETPKTTLGCKGDVFDDNQQDLANRKEGDSTGNTSGNYEFDEDTFIVEDENVDDNKGECAVKEGDVDYDHDVDLDDDVDQHFMEDYCQRISQNETGNSDVKGAAEFSLLQAIEEAVVQDASQDLLFSQKGCDDMGNSEANNKDNEDSIPSNMPENKCNVTCANDIDNNDEGATKTDMSGPHFDLNTESAHVLLPPKTSGSLNIPTVGTLVIASHAISNNGFLLEAFKVIKKNDKVILGSKKERIWLIDFFQRTFSNMAADGHISFQYPSNNLLYVEKDPVNSKCLKLHFFGAPHPYKLEFVSTIRRQLFYELALTLRRNSIMWCPSLCLKDDKDTLINIYGTTIEHYTGRKFPVEGKTSFMVARMPYEVIDVWYGCFSLKNKLLPQSATMLGSFLPEKCYEVYIIGVMDVPSAYVGNEFLSNYFLEQLNSTMYVVLANNAVQSKKRAVNNAIIVIVKRPFVLRTSHIQAMECTQMFGNDIPKGGFTAVGCALRINESSMCVILINSKPSHSSLSLRAAVIRSMINGFPFGDASVDIGVRFDYFIVSGIFNLGNDFRNDDVLIAKIKGRDLMSGMVEAPPTAAMMNATLPVRIFYAVRPNVSRLDVKQYNASSSFELPNVFLLMSIFTQRTFLNVFGEKTPSLQLVFDDLTVSSPECRTPSISDPELRISGEWISNSPLYGTMMDKNNVYSLSGNAVPMVIPVVSNPIFLRLQTVTFSLLGVLGGADKKTKSVIASGILSLKNTTRLGEFVNFSIILYYRGCYVGVLTGKVLLSAYDECKTNTDVVHNERGALVICCYENQVRDGKSWLPAVFDKHSAYPFSTKNVRVERAMENCDLPDAAKWEWLSPWSHDDLPYDPEGWKYSETFEELHSDKNSKQTKLSKVRRRRWTRVMQANDPVIYHNYVMSTRNS